MKNSARHLLFPKIVGGHRYRLIIAHKETGRRGLIDYKFFCFNGRTEFLYAMGDRTVGESVKVSILDRDFNKLQVARVGDEDLGYIKKPENYAQMLTIADKLAADFPHVRVDLYNIEGRICFGELTFYNASGYMKYEPDEFDIKIGESWELF